MVMRFCTPVLALLGWGLAASAATWPEFRGPTGQGHSDARRVPLEWSETKNVVWKTPIPGTGWSSPVVWGRQVWMTTALGEGRSLRAVGVDLDSGRVVHDVEVFTPREPAPINPKNSHASPTPAIESGRVYVHFGTMGTACLETESGRILWKNNELILDHKEGPGSSPILFEDLLIVNCDGMDVQYVVALKKDTGAVAWKTNRSAPLRDNPDFRKAYSTPLVIQVGGRPQLVSVGADQVNAYDPRTGEELWQVRVRGFSTVARPLFADGVIYVCSDYARPELWAIRADGRGNVTDTHVLWRFARQVPASPSPILVGGRIYMASNGGVATCLEARSGEQLWQERLGGNFSASPIHAGGYLYFANEEGLVTVVKPGDEFQVAASNQLDGRFLASPAVAGAALLLRTDTHLYRVEQRAAAER